MSRKTYQTPIRDGSAVDKYVTKAAWRPPGAPHPLDEMRRRRPLRPPTPKEGS